MMNFPEYIVIAAARFMEPIEREFPWVEWSLEESTVGGTYRIKFYDSDNQTYNWDALMFASRDHPEGIPPTDEKVVNKVRELCRKWGGSRSLACGV